MRRHDLGAVLRVRREYAVEAHQVHPRRRNQDGELLHQLLARHDELVSAADGALHAVPVHIATIVREPAECEGTAGAVAAQALDALVIVLMQVHAAVQREALEERLVAAHHTREGSTRALRGGRRPHGVERVGRGVVVKDVGAGEAAAHTGDHAEQQR